MSGFVKPMQLYPELRRDFIGKGLKRFLFCLIVILHVGIFVLPALWYFFRQWLKPEEEVIPIPAGAGLQGMLRKTGRRLLPSRLRRRFLM